MTSDGLFFRLVAAAGTAPLCILLKDGTTPCFDLNKLSRKRKGTSPPTEGKYRQKREAALLGRRILGAALCPGELIGFLLLSLRLKVSTFPIVSGSQKEKEKETDQSWW